MQKIANYQIQEWLFSTANGHFDIDLAESGIHPHHIDDIQFSKNYDLNYSIDVGQKELRQLIAEMYQVDAQRIVITNGSQEALYLFYRSFLSARDHVITFIPGWQQSWEVPAHIGCDVTKIHLNRDDNYQIDMDTIIDNLKPNTKLIILTSPNNPLGTVVKQQDLQALARLCHERGIFLLNDEEYLTNYADSIVHLEGQTAAVSSLSKIYGYPGLRVGWFIGDESLVNDMVNYKRYTTVTNSSLCEYLAIEVLKTYQAHIHSYHALIKQGENILKKFLCQWPQLHLINPQNTPFAYIDVPKTWNSADFCRQLLDEYKVLLMPAEVFGSSNAFRISFGRPEGILKEGLNRLAKLLKDWEAQ